ncbi:MAG: hypothetical protein ACXWM7_01140, partial [Parachlamydiaceae bacterium]
MSGPIRDTNSFSPTNPFSQNIANQSATTSTTPSISSNGALLEEIEKAQDVAVDTLGHLSELSVGEEGLSGIDFKPFNPIAEESENDNDFVTAESLSSSEDDFYYGQESGPPTPASLSEAGVGLDPSYELPLPEGGFPPLPPIPSRPGASSEIDSVDASKPISNPKVDPHVETASAMKATGLKVTEKALMAFLVIGFVACIAAAPFTGGLSLVVAPFLFFAAMSIPFMREFADMEKNEQAQLNQFQKERSSPTGALQAFEARKANLEAEIKELKARPEQLSTTDQSKLDQAEQDLKHVEEQIARENEYAKQKAAQAKDKKAAAAEKADREAELNGKDKDTTVDATSTKPPVEEPTKEALTVDILAEELQEVEPKESFVSKVFEEFEEISVEDDLASKRYNPS